MLMIKILKLRINHIKFIQIDINWIHRSILCLCLSIKRLKMLFDSVFIIF